MSDQLKYFSALLAISVLSALLIYSSVNRTIVRNYTTPAPAAQITIKLENYLYEQMLDSLKATEGFRAEPYTCPGGQRTIGYGHAIHRGDPLRVTPDQADSILRLDLNNCIERAYQLTRLKGNQLLAVASLLFGIREQSFLSSRMARKIRAGLPVDSSNWTSFNKVNGKRNRHVENFRKYQWRVYSQSF